jgi:hypothetical protein
MLSVKEIRSIESRRREMKKELYKTILKSFSTRIVNAVELGQTQAFLNVPQFVVGFPIFDRTAARLYIARQMSNLGYDVTLYGDHDMYVSWVKSKPVKEQLCQMGTFANIHKIAESLRSKK